MRQTLEGGLGDVLGFFFAHCGDDIGDRFTNLQSYQPPQRLDLNIEPIVPAALEKLFLVPNDFLVAPLEQASKPGDDLFVLQFCQCLDGREFYFRTRIAEQVFQQLLCGPGIGQPRQSFGGIGAHIFIFIEQGIDQGIDSRPGPDTAKGLGRQAAVNIDPIAENSAQNLTNVLGH